MLPSSSVGCAIAPGRTINVVEANLKHPSHRVNYGFSLPLNKRKLQPHTAKHKQ
jgi:hypothetical protein